MALKDTLFGTPTRTAVTLGAAVALIVLFVKRKKVAKAAGEAAEAVGEAVSSAVTSAQLAAVKLLMPKGTEYIADLAFEIGPKYDLSPYIILGMTYSESNLGRALKPQGAGGTGDFIPRPPTRTLYHDGKKITLQELVNIIGFPHKIGTTAEECSYMSGGKRVYVSKTPPCIIPTQRGWGHGLYQIDLQSHAPFISTGQWADARAAMEYAVKLFTGYRDDIRKAVPGIGPIDLIRASIAAYNAGSAPVISALKAGVPADKLDTGTLRSKGGTRVTFHEGYVSKVINKGSSFTPKNVA